jgi:hypothetical protein
MRKVLVAVIGACVLAFCVSAQAVHAESIKVCPPPQNQRSCPSYGSIKAAIEAVGPTSYISLTNGVYTEAGIVIANKNVTIRGQDPQETIIQAALTPCGVQKAEPVDSANNPEIHDRVFKISGDAVVVNMENLTIRHGCLREDSGSVAGGGIWSSATLSLKRVVVESNAITSTNASAIPMGGGVYSKGTLLVDSSTFLTNTIAVINGTRAYGGGVYSNGYTRIANSTIGRNLILDLRVEGDEILPVGEFIGGGIYSDGLLEAQYNTVVFNQAAVDGGGIGSSRSSVLANNLFFGNVASAGSDYSCLNPSQAQSAAPGAAAVSGCSNPQPIIDVRLAPLTRDTIVPVYPVLAESQSIDAGVCLPYVRADQLGAPRAAGNSCDLGSLERGATYLPTLIVQPQLPDLRVVAINVKPEGPINSATPVVIEVVIENVGLTEARRGFWVDLYINPRSTPPNQAGTVWSDLCRSASCTNDLGISWKVATNLLPTERLTLTSRRMEDPYIWLPSTNWNGTLNAGDVNMWAFVDSWDGADNPIGWVAEIDETNNRTGPVYRSVAVGQPQYPLSAAQFPAIVSDRPANNE